MYSTSDICKEEELQQHLIEYYLLNMVQKAMELAMEGKFNVLTVIKDGKLDSVSLEDVVGQNKKK